ncbi:MAG TPA: DUF1501 domain-containing protein [Steroidobacteraceae bacterium]|nr:DUF1501 domain-containing protein [Steroidobacteraceae bacterium]
MRQTRRSFLQTAAFAGASSLVSARFAMANAPTDSRFVFVLLRGALDGLSAVPPVGDPDYAALRGQIALARSGDEAVLPLPGGANGGLFGLHPALTFLHSCFNAKELAVLHAVATPYRERSHFDAQNVLESGVVRPQGSASGWMNRALFALGGASREAGVALGANVPLAMRGPAEVASWSPTKIAALDEATLQRVTDLYARDPLLSQRLADALESDAIATEAQAAANADAEPGQSMTPMVESDAQAKRNYNSRYAETARAAAGFLKRDDGPRVAMFDTTGWDTHANEGGAKGQLALRLRALDGGLQVLKESLGPAVWRKTVVLVATEFGRTAAINGTRGTDHGTGAAAFLLGGAVAGGRVIADWPGLSRSSLLEGRDLRPTRDLRSVMKGVLHDHLGVSTSALEARVFPDSAAATPLRDLV